MINSQEFICNHLQNSLRMRSHFYLLYKTDDRGLYHVNLDPISDAVELDHPLAHKKTYFDIVGSIDGLLCIAYYFKDKRENLLQPTIFVWNPSIRRHTELPKTDRDSLIDRALGFGYEPVNKDYKVVKIFPNIRSGIGLAFEVQVFSLRASRWRAVENLRYKHIRQDHQLHGIPVEGNLHWIASQDGITSVIMAFNLTYETCREVPLPATVRPIRAGDGFRELGSLEGCLCYIEIINLSLANIWLMRQYGVQDSWVKLVELHSKEDEEDFELLRTLKPLCYSKIGGEVLLQLNERKLLWYDLIEKSIKNFNGTLPDFFDATLCVDSLVDVKVGCDHFSDTFEWLYSH